MRKLLPLLLLCSACASIQGRPTTVFQANPDEDSQAGQHDQNAVYVLEHLVSAHEGCYNVQRPNGAGIIRCGSAGQVEWKKAEDVATGIDDRDLLKEAMKSDAEKQGAKLDSKSIPCTLVGAPGSCDMFTFTPANGGPPLSKLIGYAQFQSSSLVAQCIIGPEQMQKMAPICAEVFQLKDQAQ